jgi:hypothetical protein
MNMLTRWPHSISPITVGLLILYIVYFMALAQKKSLEREESSSYSESVDSRNSNLLKSENSLRYGNTVPQSVKGN